MGSIQVVNLKETWFSNPSVTNALENPAIQVCSIISSSRVYSAILMSFAMFHLQRMLFVYINPPLAIRISESSQAGIASAPSDSNPLLCGQSNWSRVKMAGEYSSAFSISPPLSISLYLSVGT